MVWNLINNKKQRRKSGGTISEDADCITAFTARSLKDCYSLFNFRDSMIFHSLFRFTLWTILQVLWQWLHVPRYSYTITSFLFKFRWYTSFKQVLQYSNSWIFSFLVIHIPTFCNSVILNLRFNKILIKSDKIILAGFRQFGTAVRAEKRHFALHLAGITS